MRDFDIDQRHHEIGLLLAAEMSSDGHWHGELSSSALAGAVAIAALNFYDPNKYESEIRSGVFWLISKINYDGSYGDTPESPGNVSASILAYAALKVVSLDIPGLPETLDRINKALLEKGIDICSADVSQYILNHYGNDYTFSVPILTMCGLCNIPVKDSFSHIPQLPFELALLPNKIYRWLNLSVVSYAIPALVAVGITIFKNKKSNLFLKLIRSFSTKPALKILNRMMPLSGGYLEAIPLTAFVSLSLINSGFRDSDIVKKGISFILKTQREDGSWPIDIDLSIWVTSLAVKSYRSYLNNYIDQGNQRYLLNYYLKNQNKTVHPFNMTAPGGWGWTNHDGSVPDCDDTPGAILSILSLSDPADISDQIFNAARWLKKTQNSDGGFPTFSKGWGKLPFDRSCSDLTGHVLLALSTIMHKYHNNHSAEKFKPLKKVFYNSLVYLKNNQTINGSWLPLWFGNQMANNHENPVYGTARVVSYLRDILPHKWLNEKEKEQIKLMIKKGQMFLLSTQNKDGSWGGDFSVEGTIEETALSVTALASDDFIQNCEKGIMWIENRTVNNKFKPSPIGLYFASLWYDEKLYPITFYLEALSKIKELKN